MIAKIKNSVYINLDQFIEAHVIDSTAVNVFTTADTGSYTQLNGEDAKNFLAYLDSISVDLSRWRKKRALAQTPSAPLAVQAKI